MTSLSLREPTSLLTDLVSGMQIVTNDPEIRYRTFERALSLPVE
jgi:hypothetical protein